MVNKRPVDARSGSTLEPIEYIEPSNARQPVFWPLLILFLITLFFQLGSLAYSQSPDAQSFQSMLFPSLLFISLTTLPLGAVGIWLGRDVGLGTPLLAALLRKQPGAWQKLVRDAGLAGLWGLILGSLLVFIRMLTENYLPGELPAFGYRGFIGGLVVSAGAAVGEEVWFRLGLMTILVWLAVRWVGHQKARPRVVWTIIILTSIGFGLAHLPHLTSYDAAAPFAIGGTILGNTAVGILYGWCYWRRSLLAAISAHFCVDIVIHALPALFP